MHVKWKNVDSFPPKHESLISSNGTSIFGVGGQKLEALGIL